MNPSRLSARLKSPMQSAAPASCRPSPPSSPSGAGRQHVGCVRHRTATPLVTFNSPIPLIWNELAASII